MVHFYSTVLEHFHMEIVVCRHLRGIPLPLPRIAR